MRKEGLIKYTVFLLVCFFTLLSCAFAEEVLPVTVHNFPYGSTYTISKIGYEGFKCEFKSNSVFNYSESDTGYSLKLKKVMTDDGSETVKCKYSKKLATNMAGSDTNGERDYIIYYNGGTEQIFEFYLGFGVEFIDIVAQLGASEIVDYTVESKGSEYISMRSCSKNSANCKVYMSEVAENLDPLDPQNYLAHVTFRYKIAGSNSTHTATVQFNINGFEGSFISDNWAESEKNIGVCNYGSDWGKQEYTASNGISKIFYYVSTKPNAVLPNCRPNENNAVPVEFKGWIPDVDQGSPVSWAGGNTVYVYATGSCDTAIAPGRTAEPGRYYAPCYETNKSFVLLSLSTGKVTASGWNSREDFPYQYYHEGNSANDVVNLPEVVYTGMFADKKSLQCWENQTTKECVEPGTPVKTDGTIYVAVTDTLHEENSYFKSVKVNSAVIFAVEGMTGCRVGDGQPSGYLTADSYNGDCNVIGIKETDPLGGLDDSGAPEYIEVIVSLEGDKERIYKFTVESDVGIGAAGNGQFIINPNVNSGEENDYTDSSGFKTDACTEFKISPGSSYIVPGTNGAHSNIYSVTPQCSGAGNYVAMCLDPGREAPESGETYQKVYDIKPTTRFGKLITYLVTTAPYSNLEIYAQKENSHRVAAHMSVRIVAIQSGMGASSGIAYSHLHAPYQKIADEINETNPTTSGEYANIVKRHMFNNNDSSIANEVGVILASYDNVSDDSKGFERTIDSSNVERVGNGYVITYIGTITAPANITNVTLDPPVTPPNERNGVSFEVVGGAELEVQGTDPGTGRTTYKYQVKIKASNTLAVIPPVSEKDKLDLSFKIKYEGGNSASNIFLAQPVGTAGALQRMILFDTTSDELYIYFNIAPNDCELPGLDYTQCTGPDDCPITCTSESNCPAQSFNTALFKASGCCRYVADEVTYAYVVNNICAAACTTSTMTNVCDYHTTDNLAELYEIKEGAEYNGSKTGQGSGYQNAIGACVVNVEEDIRHADDDNFEKEDDNGNSISVESYENNTYCRVNCKEDWQLSMDGFGSFVGEKAVAAGSYFQIENDLFIGGKRTCYTNYIDYNRYMNDLVTISVGIVGSYNAYSHLSHSWSDIDKQTSYADRGLSGGSYNCAYKHKYVYTYVCEADDPETEEVDESQNCDVVGPSHTKECESSNDVYYSYYLDINHKYEGVGNDTIGNHREFTTTPFDPQGTLSAGSRETQTKLDSEDGALNAYSTRPENIIVTINEVLPDSCTPAAVDGATCERYSKDEYVSTKTEQGTSVGPYHYNNSGDKTSAFTILKQEMLDRLEGDMAGPRGAVGGGAARIRKLVDQMFECQHFQLVNTTDDNNDNKPTKRLHGKYYDNTLPYIEITTAYDPDVTYEYAEDGFMSILKNNKENYLEPYDKKNDSYYGGDGKYKDATNETKDAEVKLKAGEDPVKVNLARNFMQFTYYKEGSTWSSTSEEGRNYDSSSRSHTIKEGVMGDTFGSGEAGHYRTKKITLCGISCGGKSQYVSTTNSKGITSGSYVCNDDPKWDGGACFDTYAPYLEANYIKASIENSSFYKNQGSWFNNIQDVKAHGEDLKTALNSENAHNDAGYNISKELNSERWTPIGIMNVFPVSMSTPRNLYTYTYTFKDIGSLSGGQLGRLMGAENAIIGNNNRTCFYEVFEELCLCCGDEINTYVFNDPDENDLINQVMNHAGIDGSDPDKMADSIGGTLSFATSSVNLSDVTVGAERPTATNWSDKAPFTYGGEYNLTTSKGEQLKNAIEEYGETIYSSTYTRGAEYAYYLTPTTLTEIREYNDAHGYELNFNNLKVYGRYSIAALNGCSDPSNSNCWQPSSGDKDDLFNNQIINFQHYGSIFLEELAEDPNITKSSTLARKDNDKVCLVVDGSFDAETINNHVKNGCRWIDYVENVSNNTGAGQGDQAYIYPYSVGATQERVTYFRLAFK